MGQKVAVIIGANRGIGLALAIQLKDDHTVFAGVRKSTEELDNTGVSVIPGVDVTDDTTLKPLLKALGDRTIDLMIVTAGAQEVDTLATVTKENIRRQMEANAIGPLFTVKGLQEKLKQGSKVVIISSKNASITEVENTGGELYGYRISKAAVNMAGVTLAGDLKRSPGAYLALIHPGVVNTQMLRNLRKARGVPDDKLTANTLTPEDSALKILKLLNGLSESNSGSFWAADTGNTIGW